MSKSVSKLIYSRPDRILPPQVQRQTFTKPPRLSQTLSVSEFINGVLESSTSSEAPKLSCKHPSHPSVVKSAPSKVCSTSQAQNPLTPVTGHRKRTSNHITEDRNKKDVKKKRKSEPHLSPSQRNNNGKWAATGFFMGIGEHWTEEDDEDDETDNDLFSESEDEGGIACNDFGVQQQPIRPGESLRRSNSKGLKLGLLNHDRRNMAPADNGVSGYDVATQPIIGNGGGGGGGGSAEDDDDDRTTAGFNSQDELPFMSFQLRDKPAAHQEPAAVEVNDKPSSLSEDVYISSSPIFASPPRNRLFLEAHDGQIRLSNDDASNEHSLERSSPSLFGSLPSRFHASKGKVDRTRDEVFAPNLLPLPTEKRQVRSDISREKTPPLGDTSSILVPCTPPRPNHHLLPRERPPTPVSVTPIKRAISPNSRPNPFYTTPSKLKRKRGSEDDGADGARGTDTAKKGRNLYGTQGGQEEESDEDDSVFDVLALLQPIQQKMNKMKASKKKLRRRLFEMERLMAEKDALLKEHQAQMKSLDDSNMFLKTRIDDLLKTTSRDPSFSAELAKNRFCQGCKKVDPEGTSNRLLSSKVYRGSTSARNGMEMDNKMEINTPEGARNYDDDQNMHAEGQFIVGGQSDGDSGYYIQNVTSFIPSRSALTLSPTVERSYDRLHSQPLEPSEEQPDDISRIASPAITISTSIPTIDDDHDIGHIDITKPKKLPPRRATFTSIFESRNSCSDVLLNHLDSRHKEVQQVAAINKGILRKHRPFNLNSVRQAYQMQQDSRREAKKSSKRNLALRQATLIVNWLWKSFKELFSNSTAYIIFFMLFDVISDVLFCILYLVEIQFNVMNAEDPYVASKTPRWLWISRPREIFVIGVCFSALNMVSFVTRVAFADNRWRAFFKWTGVVDLITSVPFIVAYQLQDGNLLYVPYFLRAVVVMSRLKGVLRLRGATNILRVGAVQERLILVVGALLCIIYCGICAFQYAEFYLAGSSQVRLDLMDSFYFIIISISTVGYGDITPKSLPGKWVVIFMIFVALAVLPGLISSAVETATLQSTGGGSYIRGKIKFVVVISSVNMVYRIVDLMETFLDEEQGEEKMHIVILAPDAPLPQIKTIISQSLYKDRVTYLVGNGLDVSDFKRVQLQYASAVYIMADRKAPVARKEDERNTLRAWAIHEYAPEVPLFLSNLLPETESYQEQTTTAVLCVDDLKQLILAQTTLYSGAATLIINLVHKLIPADSYDYPWKAQYGDGAGNELYSTPVNSVLVGQGFSQTAFYLYREFQVILIGLQSTLGCKTGYHYMLNPGRDYMIQEKDTLIIIAQSPLDIKKINRLTLDQFKNSLSANSGEFDENTFKTCRFDANDADKSPDCEKSPNKAKLRMADCILKSANDMVGHLLVCTGDYNVFKFLCSMRASHRLSDEYYPIVLLCTVPPTDEEFEYLNRFPDIYFVIGDPRFKRDLLRAGLNGAEKVLIMNLTGRDTDDFSDSGALMVSHLIYSMYSSKGQKKTVILDLSRRTNINYLSPAAKKSKKTIQSQSAISTTLVDEGLDYLSAPVFAAGRVIVASMLDCMLYQLVKNPTVLEVVKQLCGVRTAKDVKLDKQMNINPAHLCQVNVPDSLVGRPFVELFDEFSIRHGVVPIGIYRASDNDGLGNRLPFVYTNPLASLLLKENDVVYVLAT
ncbi:potassium channel, sub T, member 2 [Chytridiales sp. JEL 0842]|nr:potassium channel, sub T, member 2 [Chytridiales sp. JEL 0842]